MGPTKVFLSLVLLVIVKENLIQGSNTTTSLEMNRLSTAFPVERVKDNTTCSTSENSGIEETTTTQITSENTGIEKRATAHIKRKKENSLKMTDLLRNPQFRTLVQIHTGLKIHGRLTVAVIGE